MSLLDTWKNKRLARGMALNMDKIYNILEDESDKLLILLNSVSEKYGNNEKAFGNVSALVFIRYSLMDIFKLYKLLILERGEAERHVLARTLAIHLSEFIDDAGGIVGKKLNILSETLNEEEGVCEKIKMVRIIYHSIREYYPAVLLTRNNVSAHKDIDIRKQIQHMKELEEIDFDFIMAKIQLFVFLFQKMESVLLAAIAKVKERKATGSSSIP